MKVAQILAMGMSDIVIRDWTVSVFGWMFGVVDWEGLEGASVLVGPFQFSTQLSAHAVASIAAAIMVLLVGLTAYVVQGRGKAARD